MGQGDDTAWVEPTDADIEASADRLLAFDEEVDGESLAAIDPNAHRIAWITRPEQIEEPKLAFLLEHWQALAAARGGIPERRDVDILELVPAIGNLMMLEVERAGFDAIYRVYGTGVADRAGRDWTGYRVSEMNRITKTPAALLYRACYRAVYRRPAPLFTDHASARWLGVYSWRRLILPLAVNDERCARYMVGNLPVGQRPLSKEEIQEQQRRIRRG